MISKNEKKFSILDKFIFILGVLDPDDEAVGSKHIGIGCNSDVMTHSGKGISGIRIDGVSNVLLKNVKIYDLHDLTELGMDVCGSYDNLKFGDKIGGHGKQTLHNLVFFFSRFIINLLNEYYQFGMFLYDDHFLYPCKQDLVVIWYRGSI